MTTNDPECASDRAVKEPDTLSESDLQSMLEQIAAADAEISALCNGKKWRMSIPAQPDRDSDLVISRALCVASELVKRQLAAEGLVSSPASQKEPTFMQLAQHAADQGVAIDRTLGAQAARSFKAGYAAALAEVSSPARPDWEPVGIPQEGLEAIEVVVQLARSEMRAFHADGTGRCSFEDCRSQSCMAIKLLDGWLAEGAVSPARTEPRPLRELAEYIAEACNRAVAMLRREGYVFKRFPRNLVEQPPVGDGERWEAMAFSLYSDLAELDAMAVRALNAADDEAEGVVSTAPPGVEDRKTKD